MTYPPLTLDEVIDFSPRPLDVPVTREFHPTVVLATMRRDKLIAWLDAVIEKRSRD